MSLKNVFFLFNFLQCMQSYCNIINDLFVANFYNTIARGQDWLKNNSKNRNPNFEEFFFSKFFYSEKENFEEYSLILE